MMYCKRCSGKLYEEDCWYDYANVKQQQIGCYLCGQKLHIDYREWVAFKKKLYASMEKAKYKKNAKSKVGAR